VQTDHFDASVDELLEQREAARADGEYARADAIRDTLEALGVEVMDRPDGPEWRRKDEL
jgi:cysteinyl-tRNA synthetase